METTKTERIQEYNDKLRTNPLSMPVGSFKIVRTQGVESLSRDDLNAVIHQVRTFNDFTESNDPYGEHDFGGFHHKSVKYFWKIGYYAKDMMHGSEDPADIYKTVRVLTIMRDDEY